MGKKIEGLDVTGFYRIRLVDKDGNVVKYEHHNFVTNNMKKIALAESMSKMFKMNIGNPYGMIICNDNSEFLNHASSGAFANFNGFNGSDAVVLLNLATGVTMDATTKYLNIIATDGSGLDNSKITGFAVGRQSSGNLKEGVLQDITSADMMANQYQVINTFVFDLDKANGDFNWIAVVPNFQNTPYRSLMGFKCISNYNVRGTANSYVNGYVGPDVKDTKGNVLTGPSQILTFENNGSNSKWFYDIVTGEKKAVQPDDFAYNWTNTNIVGNENVGHQLVIGDYLYVLSGTTLYKIEIATGTTAGNVTIGYNYLGKDNPFGMYYDGTNIICSSATITTNESRAYISTINPSTMSVTTVQNQNYNDWGGLPTDWAPRNVMFTKVGDYYFVQHVVENSDYPDMNYVGCTIVCTDITNVCGTIVGLMPTRGFDAYVINDAIWSITEFTDQPDVYLKLTDGAANTTAYNYSGTYISNFEFSNYWSASKLDQTYTKTNEIKAIIDYGYAFSLT